MRRLPFSILALAALAPLAACGSTGSTLDTESGRVIQRSDAVSQLAAGDEVTVRDGPDVLESGGLVATDVSTTWSAMELMASELKLPVGAFDRTTGTLEVRGRLPRLDGKRMSWWVNCGSNITGDVADQSYIDVVLTLQVLPAGDAQTVIKSAMVAQAQPRRNPGARVPCTSTKRLEAYLIEEIAARALGG